MVSAEHSRTEQNITEQSGVEQQNGADQNRAEQNRTDQNIIKQNRTEHAILNILEKALIYFTCVCLSLHGDMVTTRSQRSSQHILAALLR